MPTWCRGWTAATATGRSSRTPPCGGLNWVKGYAGLAGVGSVRSRDLVDDLVSVFDVQSAQDCGHLLLPLCVQTRCGGGRLWHCCVPSAASRATTCSVGVSAFHWVVMCQCQARTAGRAPRRRLRPGRRPGLVGRQWHRPRGLGRCVRWRRPWLWLGRKGARPARRCWCVAGCGSTPPSRWATMVAASVGLSLWWSCSASAQTRVVIGPDGAPPPIIGGLGHDSTCRNRGDGWSGSRATSTPSRGPVAPRRSPRARRLPGCGPDSVVWRPGLGRRCQESAAAGGLGQFGHVRVTP